MGNNPSYIITLEQAKKMRAKWADQWTGDCFCKCGKCYNHQHCQGEGCLCKKIVESKQEGK